MRRFLDTHLAVHACPAIKENMGNVQWEKPSLAAYRFRLMFYSKTKPGPHSFKLILGITCIKWINDPVIMWLKR